MATSSASNFLYRQRLRAQVSQAHFLLFLLGAGGDSDLQGEAEMFGDILQIDIAEEYQNLPYKIMAGYIWANSYCGENTKGSRQL